MRTISLALLLCFALLATACPAGDDDGTGDDAPAADAAPPGSLPFAAPCSENAECMSGLCFPFNMDGPHCTIDCPAAPMTCPAPSSGCNGMGVCKIK